MKANRLRRFAGLCLLVTAVVSVGCGESAGEPDWHDVNFDRGPVASLRVPYPEDELTSEQHEDRWTLAPATADGAYDFSLAVYPRGARHLEALDAWAAEVEILERRDFEDRRGRSWHVRYVEDGSPIASTAQDTSDIAFYGTADWLEEDLREFFDHVVLDESGS